jgi:hypothetical protein
VGLRTPFRQGRDFSVKARFFLPASEAKSSYHIGFLMNDTKFQWPERFQKYCTEFPGLGLVIDSSRLNGHDVLFHAMEPQMPKAFMHTAVWEKGGIADPDKKRGVGHHWLPSRELVPTPGIRHGTRLKNVK